MYQNYTRQYGQAEREISPSELKKRLDAGEKISGKVNIVLPKLGCNGFARIFIKEDEVSVKSSR